jgi:hypothetical protein
MEVVMSEYEDSEKIEFQRIEACSRRESEFEEWRKILTIFIVDGDVNSASKPERPWTREPITEEKVRAVFANGYRFAMLQCLRWLEIKEQSLLIDLVDGSEKKSFQTMKNQLEQFLELKIEDSFGLNSIDGRDRYSISKNLKGEFHYLRERDVLALR